MRNRRIKWFPWIGLSKRGCEAACSLGEARNANVIPFKRPEGRRNATLLSDLMIGESAIVVSLDLPDAVQNHLMHMGFVPEARVTALRHAPAGDPTVYGIDGMEIALRRETAGAIRIQRADSGGDQLLEAAR